MPKSARPIVAQSVQRSINKAITQIGEKVASTERSDSYPISDDDSIKVPVGTLQSKLERWRAV